MSGIFISYRREETAAYAGRLRDRLVEEFGADQVFMDVDTIDLGLDFTEAIENAVSEVDALLCVMGREWASLEDERGEKRLKDPTDFVRLEMASALKRNIRVIPVLVNNAEMPPSDDLPPDLSALVKRNALQVHDARFHSDVDLLIESLKRFAGKTQTVRDETIQSTSTSTSTSTTDTNQNAFKINRIAIVAGIFIIVAGGWYVWDYRNEQRIALEQAERERAAVEQAERERVAKEQAAQERAAAEQAERERVAKEQAAQERAAAEQAERERVAKEQAARERAAAEQAERERVAKEQAAQERAAAEQAERERVAKEQAAQERAAAEQAERERVAKEQAALERAAAEQAERERVAKEQAALERAAAEQAERERIAKERAERERAAEEIARARRLVRPYVLGLPGADTAIESLRAKGYPANAYGTQRRSPDNFQVISIGSKVPAKFAQEVIAIARRHLPDLRYVVITEDRPDVARSGGQIGGRDAQQEIGIGVTNRAIEGFRHIRPLTDPQFSRLLSSRNDTDFKRAVRANYSLE